MQIEFGRKSWSHYLAKEIPLFGGRLTFAFHLEAQHLSKHLQHSIGNLHARLNNIRSRSRSHRSERLDKQKFRGKHCLLALKFHVKAGLQRPSGQTHVILRWPLAQIPPGKQLPEPIPLSLVHLVRLGVVQTLRLIRLESSPMAHQLTPEESLLGATAC